MAFYDSSSNYKEIMFKIVDPSMVPVDLGGTCAWVLPKGGPIPNYNLKFPEDTREWTKVNVPRADKFILNKHFSNETNDFKLEFRTKDYDIDFGIFYSGENPQFQESNLSIIPNEKVQSQISPIIKVVKIEKAGYYHLVWDNTFSWTKSKDLEYILETK